MKCFTLLFQITSIYFGQNPPGVESKVFAPGIVSIDSVSEFGSTFSNDLTEFYFGVETKSGRAETHYMEFYDNQWSKREPLLFHNVYSYNDPVLSHDQKRLYFISDMPLSGEGPKKDFDIWYVERTNEGWSKPINAGPSINSDKNEYYVSFTSNGKMYFSSGRNATKERPMDYDVYSSTRTKDGFLPAEKLGPSINSDDYEGDVFIAMDESYIIVARQDLDATSINGGDLFISFRTPDKKWTPLKNMGDKVNGPRFDYCPFVTPDGKFLLYTRAEEIRWVDAKIIELLKK
jgi:hypothetical protein